jgi:AhpD family alkylhydroperoxidase
MGRAVNRLVDAAYNKSILPVRVREAARMRIAQLNDCPVCLSFRAESVKEQGITEDFYRHVADQDVEGRSRRNRGPARPDTRVICTSERIPM